ncbi:MAG: type II secretion system protein [Tepidanaerobacteraceae bacterium]|nr:type II secretion system protein [Tepidanaerobacteraceae bacterium]
MRSEGYTLIEIIVAVTILTIIVAPVGTLLSQSMYSNIKSKEIIVATALAQDKIEELKALPFYEVLDKYGQQHDYTIESNSFSFLRSVQAQKESANLLKITVKVKGDNGVINIVTYRGKY